MNRIDVMNNLPKRKAKDIDLKELFLVIKRRLWLIIVITIITTGLGTYYSHSNNTPIYQSSSRIIIGANPEDRNTMQVIIKDSTILDKVVKELGLAQSAEGLAGQITVSSVDNSQVVSISVTDTDPNRAADIANKTARVFKQEIKTIMNFDNVRILSDAKVNPWPINQSQNKLIIIGFIAGLVIGIGLVFLLDSLDDSLRSEREVEEMLGLPVLGRVPKMHKRNLKKKNFKQIGLEGRGETIGYK
ncbi:YveK family protein [Neobacillus sp. NPDC097160]|uniref:YveK family protein n=1 Tax=Neobacillus sp. NPDC097160 TaxID=3364298 RepID=UPI003803114E